jgi:hypothetical protein
MAARNRKQTVLAITLKYFLENLSNPFSDFGGTLYRSFRDVFSRATRSLTDIFGALNRVQGHYIRGPLAGAFGCVGSALSGAFADIACPAADIPARALRPNGSRQCQTYQGRTYREL